MLSERQSILNYESPKEEHFISECIGCSAVSNSSCCDLKESADFIRELDNILCFVYRNRELWQLGYFTISIDLHRVLDNSEELSFICIVHLR